MNETYRNDFGHSITFTDPGITIVTEKWTDYFPYGSIDSVIKSYDCLIICSKTGKESAVFAYKSDMKQHVNDLLAYVQRKMELSPPAKSVRSATPQPESKENQGAELTVSLF